MKIVSASLGVLIAGLLNLAYAVPPLGLPPVPVPTDNPMTSANKSMGATQKGFAMSGKAMMINGPFASLDNFQYVIRR